MLVGLLGGRAAEEIVFDTVTTGASNDIERATSIARSMITQYGMSKKFGLIGLESVQHKYLDGRAVSNCADETSAEIDKEIMELLKESYEEAKTLLRDHRATMDKIAAFLIEKETITGKEFMEIFHQMEGIDPKAPRKEEPRIAMNPVEGESQAVVDGVTTGFVMSAPVEEAAEADTQKTPEAEAQAQPQSQKIDLREESAEDLQTDEHNTTYDFTEV